MRRTSATGPTSSTTPRAGSWPRRCRSRESSWACSRSGSGAMRWSSPRTSRSSSRWPTTPGWHCTTPGCSRSQNACAGAWRTPAGASSSAGSATGSRGSCTTRSPSNCSPSAWIWSGAAATIPPRPPVLERVTAAKSLARSAVNEIRAVIFELASDGDIDLRQALHEVIEDVVAGTRLQVRLRTYGSPRPVAGRHPARARADRARVPVQRRPSRQRGSRLADAAVGARARSGWW